MRTSIPALLGTIVAILLAAAVLISIVIGSSENVQLVFWPFNITIQMFLPMLAVSLFVVGAISGFLIARLANTFFEPIGGSQRPTSSTGTSFSPARLEEAQRDRSRSYLRIGYRYLAVLALFVFTSFGVLTRTLSSGTAVLMCVFGVVVLLTCISIMERLQAGEAFEIQSHWGGLGGGIGGWRISPLAGLTLIALIFAAATFAVSPASTTTLAPSISQSPNTADSEVGSHQGLKSKGESRSGGIGASVANTVPGPH